MQTVLAWILVGLVIAAAYPAAARLLPQENIWLKAAVSLGLSTGILTLVMFWEALLGIRWSALGITLPYFGIMASIAVLAPRFQTEKPTQEIEKQQEPQHTSRIWKILAGVVLISISAAILFNAVYWPFHKDDVLGIYGKYGTLMYKSETLVPFAGRDDAFYQAYPMHIPLAYTYAFMASGWENEYLAGVIPALLSLGCLLAVYGLGRMLYGESAGLLGAVLLALTPQFARWASSGYVDLPMAFYYALAAIFLWRLWKDDKTIDAVLAGGAFGFGAWTKNAALMGIVFAGLWMGYGWLRGQIRIKNIGITALSCALIAAPWYIRNTIEAGLIVPPTAWTEQAERTLGNLLVFISQPENFALTGWVVMVGIAVGSYATIRQQAKHESVLLLLLTVPFFGVWWLLVSYDPRFLLLFLPLLVVLASGVMVNLWKELPNQGQQIGGWVIAAAAIGMTVYIVWISVEFKDEIIRNPMMSDAEKQAIVMQTP